MTQYFASLKEEWVADLRQFCIDNPLDPEEWKAFKVRHGEEYEKEYVVEEPDGSICDIKGLTHYCRTKDINVGHLHATLTGGRLHTKGYRLIPQTPEQIKRHSDTRAIKEDSSRKGHAGSKNGRAKLDIHKVRQIRQHHKDKTMDNRQMANHFNVSLPAIEAIVYGRTWKDA